MPELLVAAALELADAAQWYDSHQAGLGGRLLDEARDAFDRIDRMPLAGSPWLHAAVPDGTRRVVLLTFPYTVVYVTDPRTVVVAIAHAKRRPTYWIDRLDGI